MNKPKLLPCPMCGSEARIVTTAALQQPTTYTTTACTNDDCRMSDQHDWFHVDNEQMAVDAWNTRHYAIDENHPKFEALVRAFWRRIDGYKNNYDKELPSPLPVEFRAHMSTALSVFR